MKKLQNNKNRIKRLAIMYPLDVEEPKTSEMADFVRFENDPIVDFNGPKIAIDFRCMTTKDKWGYLNKTNLSKIKNILNKSTPLSLSMEKLKNMPVYSVCAYYDLTIYNDTSVDEYIQNIVKRTRWPKTFDFYYSEEDKSDGLSMMTLTGDMMLDRGAIFSPRQEVRYSNPKYADLFSKEFIAKQNNIVRFERFISSQELLQTSYGFPKDHIVTINDILDSDVDIVTPMINCYFPWLDV